MTVSFSACVWVSLALSTEGDIPTVWVLVGVSLLSSSSQHFADLFIRVFFVFSTASMLKPMPLPWLPL